jgi:hypothetical protein
MAYGWENYLIFDSNGEIKILDAELAKRIQDQLAANNRKLYMYYITPGGPGQKENVLCTCRATGR